MSASPVARQTTVSKSIPWKKILYTDSSELPVDYAKTPGGTLYSTTPGGSKVVYQKNTLMNLRNSPISKTPPKWDIPVHLMKDSPPKNNLSKNNNNNNNNNNKKKPQRSPVVSVNEVNDDADQFHMDM